MYNYNVMHENELDKYLVGNAEKSIELIKKDVNNDNPTELDKLGRLLTKNSTLITVLSVTGAAGNPILIPATFLGAVMGCILGSLFTKHVMGLDPIDCTDEYKQNLSIQRSQALRYRAKFEKEGDKQGVKRCDDLVKEIDSINRTIDKKQADYKKKNAVKESVGTAQGVKLVWEYTKLR